MRQCSNLKCDLLWMDPMPVAEDLSNAYESYYTHSSSARGTGLGLLSRWRIRSRDFIRSGYWWNAYGYRLGSGDWMVTMQELGWKVEGIDFDSAAVQSAVELGLSARCGSLEQQHYPDRSFDAVTLSHVIEHVPNPIETLIECARILKPGGMLIVLTPNAASLSHRIFKSHWRGLEPPRHLHIFTLDSMGRALESSGLKCVAVLPLIVTSVIYESIQLWRGGTRLGNRWTKNLSAWVLSRMLKILELPFVLIRHSSADCMIAIARKK
jgi:SAM-dependent methyltransferase